MYKWIIPLIFLTGCFFDNGVPEKVSNFCNTIKDFSKEFVVVIPTADQSGNLSDIYGCPPRGKSISPPINWAELPQGTEYIYIVVEDATCTYMCNKSCKFRHWVLNIPVEDLKDQEIFTSNGIKQGASMSPKMLQYTLPNDVGKTAYMHFCPPSFQQHAYVVKLTAYRKETGGTTILKRAQSRPYTFWAVPK